MALQLVNHKEAEVNSKEAEEIVSKKEQKEKESKKVDLCENHYKCNVCNFKREKQITLGKHMNTKHIQNTKKSEDWKSQLETKDIVTSVKKNACKAKLYCGECDFSSTNKKSLKKHVEKVIHNDNDSEIS